MTSDNKCLYCEKIFSTKQNTIVHMKKCNCKNLFEENKKLNGENKKLNGDNKKLNGEIRKLNGEIKSKDKIIQRLTDTQSIIDTKSITDTQSIIDTKSITDTITDNIVYLVQPIFLVGTNRYKIGCSKESRQRLLSYMRGSRILFVFNTKNCCYSLEEKIKNEFSKKFNRSAGQELFEGDEYEMKNVMLKICQGIIINDPKAQLLQSTIII